MKRIVYEALSRIPLVGQVFKFSVTPMGFTNHWVGDDEPEHLKKDREFIAQYHKTHPDEVVTKQMLEKERRRRR